jgi:hypothetical protein
MKAKMELQEESAVNSGHSDQNKEFEMRYRDVFQKAVDLITYYTGIRINYEIGDFKYETKGSFKRSGCNYKRCPGCGGIVINPKIGFPARGHRTDLTDKFYVFSAAHEAGEISYNVARHLMGRRSYRISAELVGEFFERLLLEKNFPEVGLEDDGQNIGRYKIAEEQLNELRRLPLDKQLEKIRKHIFVKENPKLDIIQIVLKIADKVNGV